MDRKSIQNLIDEDVYGDILLHGAKFLEGDNVITVNYLKNAFLEFTDELDDSIQERLLRILQEDPDVLSFFTNYMILSISTNQDVRTAFKAFFIYLMTYDNDILELSKNMLISFLDSDNDVRKSVKLMNSWIILNDDSSGVITPNKITLSTYTLSNSMIEGVTYQALFIINSDLPVSWNIVSTEGLIISDKSISTNTFTITFNVTPLVNTNSSQSITITAYNSSNTLTRSIPVTVSTSSTEPIDDNPIIGPENPEDAIDIINSPYFLSVIMDDDSMQDEGSLFGILKSQDIIFES